MPQTNGLYQGGGRLARSCGYTMALAALSFLGATGAASALDIETESGDAETADFDIVQAQVTIDGSDAVFRMAVAGEAGGTKPEPAGELPGSQVFAYVWPTSIDPGEVGFESGTGILAMAVTAHPDFDDTPLYDETADGDTENDGNEWHSHWVVLGPDEACGPGALKVIDIPEGTEPRLPETWPGLALLIDSPDFEPTLEDEIVEVRAPFDDVSVVDGANYDGVTSGLRVNANLHAPLLCVENVFDIASGDLSLPGTAE